MKCEQCKDEIVGTAQPKCQDCTTDDILKSLVGKKVLSAGTINGVPAIKLADDTTIWIENLARYGKMLIK